MIPFSPRIWQRYGADQVVAAARAGADRALIYACPGSGKTAAGLLTALDLIRRVKATAFVVVITPNLAIKSQWIGWAETLGLNLLEVTDPDQLRQPQLPLGAYGYVLSYQQAINIKRSLHLFCETHRPVVILDEVHHTAGSLTDRDGNAWGVAVEWACGPASFKLCTTGTPFRQGNSPIAFVHYNEAGEATATVRYTYEQAIKDGVCRPIEFEFYDGDISWESRAGSVVTADFTDKLTKKLTRERLEAALSTDGQFPFRMLAAAHAKLSAIRAGVGVDATAAGLVVAMDTAHANAIAGVLTDIAGAAPVVVHNKIDDAQDLIAAFREGSAPWIVGINMLSEGVDIPRLRVGVYATRIRAPLYFHQFCGRFARVQESRRERSFVYLPRDPELEEIAVEIEKEKYHALGEDAPFRPKAGQGDGRGRRTCLAVEDSDGAAVASAYGGMVFPRRYIEAHRERVVEFKRRNPANHDTPEVEILKWMIDLGAIEGPPPLADAAE